MNDVTFISHADDVLNALEAAIDNALEEIGMVAETYAKDNLTAFPHVDTGRLRNSISHASNHKDEAYVGCNTSYAIWAEIGTGIYASDGNGRKTPWFFEDAKGKWHITHGIKPAHYLERAASEHVDEWANIIVSHLKGS